MKLVQIFLPRFDNNGQRLPTRLFAEERKLLVDKFGGMTAHVQAPAIGLWKDGPRTKRDEIVIYEVMPERYRGGWWKSHRLELQKSFRQKEILIRVSNVKIV
jgi:hypothetical protein